MTVLYIVYRIVCGLIVGGLLGLCFFVFLVMFGG